MFYRRKVVLALLEVFGNELDKIHFQTLLFLLTKAQKKAEYDFIPYKYGCFSFSLHADIVTMNNKELLEETETTLIKKDTNKYFTVLKEDDKALLQRLYIRYKYMNTNELMIHSYEKYPFWAINSIKAKEILSDVSYTKVLESMPKSEESILYTIGYEGVSLELYLMKLIKNNVKLLVDVRRNPLSMKFGFSKNLLQKYCNMLDIDYIHFPEVGIQSQERKELLTQKDYDILFINYKECNLPNTLDIQNKIIDLLNTYQRIALTCFEANICQCHRKHLAEAIQHNPNFKSTLKHI